MRNIRGIKAVAVLLILALVVLIVPQKITNRIKLFPATLFQNVYGFVNKPQKKAETERDKRIELQRYALKLQRENYELKKLLKDMGELRQITGVTKRNFISARVISTWDSSQWRKSMIIDAGSADGVEENFPVVVGNKVLGRISEVSDVTSRVQLINDPGFRIRVRLQNAADEKQGIQEGYLANLYGTSDREPVCELKYVQTNLMDMITKGTVVVTAMDSRGYWADGLIVGEVEQLSAVYGEYLKVTVTPAIADLDKIAYIMVIKPDDSMRGALEYFQKKGVK